MIGTGNAGWTTSKSGQPCPCQNCSRWPLVEKAEGGSLLTRPLCPPDNPARQGTDVTDVEESLKRTVQHQSVITI